MAFEAEKRLEDLPDRLAEAFGRVLHSRRLRWKTAVPRRRRAHAAVVEPVNDPHCQQHDRRDDDQHDQRAVARAIGVDRREQQPVAALRRNRRCVEQHRVDRIDRVNDVDRKNAEHDASCRKPYQRVALEPAGVMRIGEIRFARTTEEDDAVELDHHVRGERDRQHERSRGERHQHIDERLGQARREQKCLEQQPLRHEAVQRR